MPHDHIAALSKGYRLKEYVIERVLGQGAFGITYLALDSNLNSWVAIKEYLPDDLAVRDRHSTVIPKSSASRPNYLWGLERFLSEAQTVARFNHPNIVRVLRLMRENGTAYIVMPYERGRSLADHLQRLGRPLREGEMLALLRPLLDGLAAVHAEDVLHRDIKPGNVFLRTDGTPVLLDFGSARQAVRGERRDLTSVLTPGYAPIEQYADSGHQGPWTDIYALGAVLYRSLTGKTPVDATMRSEEALNRRPDPLVSASRYAEETYPGQYSPGLLQAIDRALSLVAGERPQSIAEWLQILPVSRREPTGRRSQGPESTPPSPPSPPPLPDPRSEPQSRPAAPTRRAGRRVLPLGLGLAGLALLAAGGLALGPWSPWSPLAVQEAGRPPSGTGEVEQATAPAAAPATALTPAASIPAASAPAAPEELPPADPPDDPETAVDYWRERAEAGNTEAQLRLGLAYLEGDGVSQDFRRAARWLRAAAEAGDPVSQTRLGLMYRDGRGVRADAARSVEWLERAAQQGHADGQVALAMAYRDGLGVAADPDAAALWSRRAADQGNARGQAVLGLLYAEGSGVPRDPAMALDWLRRAAAQNHQGAALAISDLYEQGRGVARDTAEAVRWAARAMAGDDRKTARDARLQLQALGDGAWTLAAYRMLRDAGYAPGPERPWPSAELRTAIRAFQRDSGRRVDGAVSPALLSALAAGEGPARAD